MHATAFIIASQSHCNQGLMDLSLDIGFRAVLNFHNIAQAEQQVKRTPICFFLFALDHAGPRVPGISRAIRKSRNRQIMFAPIIGFTENADPRIVKACLQFGFDDILIPPFSARTVTPRLNLHLNHRVSFFETTSYFGPDRRVGQGIHKERGPHPDRGKGGDHRKVVISRNLESGVTILKDEFHRTKKRPAVAPHEHIAI